MRKVLSLLLVGIVMTLSLSVVTSPKTFAFDPLGDACSQAPDASACKNTNSSNPLTGKTGILTKVAKLLVVVIGIVAVVMIVIAGIMLVISQGDPQKVATARETIIYALVGIAVAVLAQAIIVFVLTRIKK